MKNMKLIISINGVRLILVSLVVIMTSCENFLDEKPDKKMEVPSTLVDCDALMDNVSVMNGAYPVAGEVACDDYYLSDEQWNSILENEQRENYLWNPTVDIGSNQWQDPYKVIMIGNQVLEVLNTIDREKDIKKFDRIKGQAYFYRAYALFQLTSIFAEPYREQSAEQQLGLVLRVTPNVDEISKRVNLKQTFDQIIYDFRQATKLLTEKSLIPTRPSKEAAHAALARVFLYMADYKNAIIDAENALKISDELLDYNILSTSLAIPFKLFNTEVIFHASTFPSSAINPNRATIDTPLYDLFSIHDKRRELFFKKNVNGTYSFKGRYDSKVNSSTFSGIGRDEVFLTLAESYIRLNRITEGINLLNRLLRTRWDPDFYTNFEVMNKKDALNLTLTERRKQLLFRNIRWMDLKRLSDSEYSKVLIRNIGTQQYILEKNDKRYTFLIPMKVIQYSSINQNNR